MTWDEVEIHRELSRHKSMTTRQIADLLEFPSGVPITYDVRETLIDMERRGFVASVSADSWAALIPEGTPAVNCPTPEEAAEKRRKKDEARGVRWEFDLPPGKSLDEQIKEAFEDYRKTGPAPAGMSSEEAAFRAGVEWAEYNLLED